MFIGQYQHSLDDKGRLQVPKKFRTELGEKAVITEGLDGCLFLHSQKRWEEFEEELVGLPVTRSDARVFSRHMLANAAEVGIDETGRVLIPEFLRQKAGLQSEAKIVGVGTRIEIWQPARWGEYQKQISPEEVSERLGEMGF